MKSLLISFVILLVAAVNSYSQDFLSEIFTRKEANNTVVGSAGTVFLANEFNVAYERKLVTFKKRDVKSVWLKGRYTRFGGLADRTGASFFDVSAMALLGARSSFTEVGAGIGIFPAESTVYPTGLVGYRYQRSKGGIVLRAGIGYPELLYIGLGYAF